MTPSTELFRWLGSLLGMSSLDVAAWLRAWARVSPLLALVPIFGGAALPSAARAGLGFALALAIAPALRPIASSGHGLLFELGAEGVRGLPVALSAALLVHTALMAGGLCDELRAERGSVSLPVFDAAQSPLGTLLGLLVTLSLLESGGAAQLLAALAVSEPAPSSLLRVAAQLRAAVGIAIAVSAPVLAASVVLSVAEALLARAAAPTHIGQMLSPLRSIALLAVVALGLDRLLLALLASAS